MYKDYLMIALTHNTLAFTGTGYASCGHVQKIIFFSTVAKCYSKPKHQLLLTDIAFLP